MRKTVHSLLGGKRRSSRKGPDFTQTQLHPASRSLLQPVCKARKQHNFWTMRKNWPANISQVPLQFRCQLEDLQELEMTTVIDPIRNSKDHTCIYMCRTGVYHADECDGPRPVQRETGLAAQVAGSFDLELGTRAFVSSVPRMSRSQCRTMRTTDQTLASNIQIQHDIAGEWAMARSPNKVRHRYVNQSKALYGVT